MSSKLYVIINENMVFFQTSLFNGNHVFTDMQMKLLDSAFNIDVKNAHTS